MDLTNVMLKRLRKITDSLPSTWSVYGAATPMDGSTTITVLGPERPMPLSRLTIAKIVFVGDSATVEEAYCELNADFEAIVEAVKLIEGISVETKRKPLVTKE